MARDIIHEEDWGMAEEHRQELPPRPSRSSGGGSGNSLKDYVIVALIAIVAVMGVNNFIYARTTPAGVAGGGGGCCGGGSGGAAQSSADLERIGLEFYAQTTGESNFEGVTAQVKNFGCHQEIYIFKNGEQVMRIGYASGQVYQM